MRIKRLVAVVLAASLAVSMMAGCSKSTEKEEGTPAEGTQTEGTQASPGEEISFPLAEPVTMSMFAIMNGEHDLKDNTTMKYLETSTNVTWDVQSVMGTDLAEKKGLILASNDYPDVFYKAGLTNTELEKYGKQGIFIPLNDLIDQHAPNIKKVLDERNAWEYITASDGNIYSLPEVDVQTPANAIPFINQKWLKNLGLEEPKNLDELYNVFKAFKEQDANGNGDANDEIPFIANADATPIRLLLQYFDLPIDYGTYCAIVEDELIYVPVSEKFKEFLEFTKKLYSEGLLDKNSFTQKQEQQKAIGASGDVLGCFFDAGAFLTVGRERDRDFTILTPFSEGTFPTNTGITPGTFAITDTCKDPVLAIKWADQFYTQEGGVLAWLGIENDSYKMNEDGTWDWILGEGQDIGYIRQVAPLQGAAHHPSIQPELWFTGLKDVNEKYLNEERARITGMGAEPFPALRIGNDDMQSIASIKADVDVYIDQYIAQVVTGEQDLESSWSTYLDTLNQMGAEQMIKIYQDTYKATK